MITSIKYVLVLVALCVGGCLPATRLEVQDLTSAVSAILPAVRVAVADSSDDTKDKIEIVLGRVEALNDEVATAEDPLDAVSKGWDASKPFNPYYTHGALILGVLGMFFKQKKTKTALEEVVVGVDDLGKLNPTISNEPLKAAASVATRKIVDKIRKAT